MNSDEEKPYTKSRFTTLQFKRFLFAALVHHCNSSILKFDITIILLSDSCHLLRLLAAWVHSHTIFVYKWPYLDKNTSTNSLSTRSCVGPTCQLLLQPQARLEMAGAGGQHLAAKAARPVCPRTNGPPNGTRQQRHPTVFEKCCFNLF